MASCLKSPKFTDLLFKLRNYLYIILFGLIATTAQGQDHGSWEVGITGGYGFLMPHHPEMAYLIAGHTPMADLTISKRVSGEKDWHHYFNFPSYGLTLAGYDLVSPYLGNAYAARWFIDLPLDKSRLLRLKMDLGAGYITEPFSVEENIHNSAIGSYLNASLALKLYGAFPITKHVQAGVGIGVHHFSNGAFKMPNSGINLAMGEVSLKYTLSPELPERDAPELKADKNWHFFAGGSYGIKEIPPNGGEKYNVINIYGQALKRISPKSSLGGELGVNYNESLRERSNQKEEGSGTSSENYRLYIAGTHQLHFDPLGLRFQLGAYIAPEFELDSPIFLRYHLYHDIGNLQAFVGLKSHFAKADNIEVGINYRVK